MKYLAVALFFVCMFASLGQAATETIEYTPPKWNTPPMYVKWFRGYEPAWEGMHHRRKAVFLINTSC